MRRKWEGWACSEDGLFVQTAGKKRRQPSKRRVGKKGEKGRMMDG